MADLTPIGAVQSFAGTSITGGTNVASVGFPSIDKQPVEAYEQTIGSDQVVDLLNGVTAPGKSVLSCEVLIRASDGTTDPAAAWAAVVAGYRALESMAQTGTLVVNSAPGAGSVSCTARRKPISIQLKPNNARHLVVLLTFTLLSDWA